MATRTAAAEALSYEDLYSRWEHGNWKATELDFSQDREDWREKFSDLERRAALWNYAMFFHGEDSVADNLSPYIDAAPREEQKYFLTTQQVDEARHAVFFARFMSEVVETGNSIGASLATTQPELSWGFKKVFARLDKMADELRKDRSKPKLGAAITLYHFVVEASLAQPGQHFIEDYLAERGVLPGFYEGMQNVSRDEQRHIGFGVKLLSDLKDEDPDVPAAVAEVLREVIPWATAVFVPPGWDERYITCFGSTMVEVFQTGANSLDSKLRAAGLPPDDLPGGVPLESDLTAEERAKRGIAFLRGNILGEKNGPPSTDPELLDEYFDSIRRGLSQAYTGDEPITLQWDFRDLEPWHLRIDNGSSDVGRGRLESADITFRCRFEDWVDVSMGREDARKALARGRVIPHGKPRALWRARSLFQR
jgi:Ribonucleotide reductase, small chain/SCP-2 sterol transfer family